jgi:hypothetical protein
MDQYVHTLAQQQEQLPQTQHQLMVQLAALTLNHGEGRGVGQQRHPNIPPPPPLHQPSWDTTIVDTVGDEDAEEAVDHSFSRGAIHPPRCLSLQDEIHLLLPTHLAAGDILHLLLHTHLVAGDILRPCTRRI